MQGLPEGPHFRTRGCRQLQVEPDRSRNGRAEYQMLCSGSRFSDVEELEGMLWMRGSAASGAGEKDGCNVVNKPPSAVRCRRYGGAGELESRKNTKLPHLLNIQECSFHSKK